MDLVIHRAKLVDRCDASDRPIILKRAALSAKLRAIQLA
jgi:hypothetical protein